MFVMIPLVYLFPKDSLPLRRNKNRADKKPHSLNHYASQFDLSGKECSRGF